jgi:hypothetical protein
MQTGIQSVGVARYRARVDIEWARSKLTKYLELEQACRDAVLAGDYWNERARAINDQATEMLPTITRILEALGAPPSEPLLPPSYRDNPQDRQPVVAQAATLRSEGLPVIRRWKFLVVGATSEDESRELADQIRREAPTDARVRAEPSPSTCRS